MKASPHPSRHFSIPKHALAVLLLGMAGLVMGQVTTTYSTSGSYTFTVPAGVTSVTVECWGGGGNGGNRTSNGTTGGGGGGAYARSVISVVPGSTYDVRVGTGGSATSVTTPGSWIET